MLGQKKQEEEDDDEEGEEKLEQKFIPFYAFTQIIC